MILTVPTASSTFEPCPAGSYAARLVRVVDMGSEPNPFKDGAPRRRVHLAFEVVDPETRMPDGRGYLVSKPLTLSLSDKAELRHMLTAWRGKDLTPGEQIDVFTLIGKPCLLGVVHKAKPDGGTYANVGSIGRVPKGLPCPEASEPLLAFDLDRPDWEAFEALPEWLRTKIASSPEFAAARQKPSAPALADMDDDVPY